MRVPVENAKHLTTKEGEWRNRFDHNLFLRPDSIMDRNTQKSIEPS
jgi:hypothetical protein